MGLGRLVSEVAAELRRRVIRGEYGNGGLPGERKLREALNCSRSTLQPALAALQVEGLLYSVPKEGWFQRDLRTEGSFDLFATVIQNSTPAEWHDLVAQLLDYRCTQVISGVDAFVRSGQKTTLSLKVWTRDLPHPSERGYWSDVCRVEDRIFTELLSSETNLPQTMAANQLRRALAVVRGLLQTNVRAASQREGFDELFRAIDAGDRQRSVELAAQLATAHDSIYLDLMRRAVAAPWVKNDGENADFDASENGLT